MLSESGEITYRAGTKEDWKDAVELAWHTFCSFDATFFVEEGQQHFREFLTGETLYYFFTLGAYQLYLAMDGELLIGMVLMRQARHVSLLFVEGAYHRKGIGSGLLTYGIEETKGQRGNAQITVNASPYAVEFYKKNGFVEDGEKVYEDGIYYHPMRK